jgi:hypothetical protein
MLKFKWYAVVGDNGSDCPVVWGVGYTPDQALANATDWLKRSNAKDEIFTVEVTEAQYRAVLAGVISFDDLARVV